MLKLRQYLCKHDFKLIAKHKCTSQNLWQCKKCGVFVIQHWGIGLNYKCKVPNICGWVEVKEELK